MRGPGCSQHYPDAPLRPRLVAVADTDAERRTHGRSVDAFGFARAARRLARPDRRATTSTWSACAAPTSCTATWPSPPRESGQAPVGREAGRSQRRARPPRSPRPSTQPGVQSAVGFNYRNAPAVELAARAGRSTAQLGDAARPSTVRFLADYAAHPDGALSWRFDPTSTPAPACSATWPATGSTWRATSPVRRARSRAGRRPGDASSPSGRSRRVPCRTSPAAAGDARPGRNEDHVSALLRFAVRRPRHSSRRGSHAVGEQCTLRHRGPRRRGRARAGTSGGWASCRSASARTTRTRPGRPRSSTPAHGELGAFQPGAGIAMGYDDLKVIEADRLARSIADGKPRRRHHRRRPRRRPRWSTPCTSRSTNDGGCRHDAAEPCPHVPRRKRRAHEPQSRRHRRRSHGRRARARPRRERAGDTRHRRLRHGHEARAARSPTTVGATVATSAEALIGSVDVDAVVIASPDLHASPSWRSPAWRPASRCCARSRWRPRPRSARRVVEAEVAGGRTAGAGRLHAPLRPGFRRAARSRRRRHAR